MGLTRFELVTPRLSSVCSNQLSYRPGILFKELSPDYSGVPVLSKLDRRAIDTKLIRARSIFECPTEVGNTLERR